MDKEKIRRDLLERYISTGKVGLIKPASDEEAVDLIETVVGLYGEEEEKEPEVITLADMSARFKAMLDF